MKMIDLEGGSASLEFVRADWPAIKSALQAYGRVSIKHDALYDSVSVNGATLILYHEWDEPCLIANSPPGLAILTDLLEGGEDRAAAE